MTQKEIARKFGISESAVSLVLNKPNTKAVGPDLKKRILAEYRKGAGARLRQKTSIGYLVDFKAAQNTVPYSAYYLQLMDGLKQEAATQGCRLVLIDSLENLIAAPESYAIDGLVIQAGVDKQELAVTLKRYPTVLLNNVLDEPVCDAVAPDNRDGVRKAVAYLVQRGHRRIAFMGFRNDLPSTKSYQHALERQQGYVLGLWEHGLPYREDLVCFPLLSEALDRFGGMERVAEERLSAWTSAQKPPTAIVCHNDHMAEFCRAAAERLQIGIPRQISLIGFDNTAFCETVRPTLTSIGTDLQDMARVAVDLLLMRLHSRFSSIPRTVYCPTVLTERDSVRSVEPSPPKRRARTGAAG